MAITNHTYDGHEWSPHWRIFLTVLTLPYKSGNFCQIEVPELREPRLIKKTASLVDVRE